MKPSQRPSKPIRILATPTAFEFHQLPGDIPPRVMGTFSLIAPGLGSTSVTVPLTGLVDDAEMLESGNRFELTLTVRRLADGEPFTES